MGLTGLFSQAVGVGCCGGSLGDMGLVGRACVPALVMGAIEVLGGLGKYRGIVFSRGEIEARLFGWGPGLARGSGVRFLLKISIVWQLAYTMFINNNGASFYLW